MLTPLDLDRIQASLRAPNGWIELATIALCVAIAWAIDRRVYLTSARESRVARLGAGSLNRLIFPLIALALLYVARAVFRHWQVPAFFPIALPLVVAFALIRLSIYALRNLFGVDAPSASERTLSLVIWGALLLYYVGVLPEIGAALEDAHMPIGKGEVSVLDLGRDAIVIIIVIVLSFWASSLLEQRLMRGTHLDQNLRVVVAKVSRALLLVVGLLVALSFVGVDVTVLSVFGGALGVGIGLGLQKLASNYIAGFTILLDRSVRLGDMITVDNRTGTVSVVSSRYVVLLGLDGVESIVPNEMLVTTTVLNHSYTSRDVRLNVLVQVGYDSDLELAMRLMSEVAAREPRVLHGALAPVVNVLQFADNGIALELAFWINDPELGQGILKSALNIGIWKAFRDNGIRIPHPQRDVRILDPLPAGKSETPPPV
ncbi:MAG TPA: mechanosensitive ion channel domain-containing protein [Casimicrobiaceae bacterium]|jgi:small-conductance mechanosensitive channel|nr:mechanosensitive ion channel domain-containing protein [Casimicrobiaceae bacterium]